MSIIVMKSKTGEQQMKTIETIKSILLAAIMALFGCRVANAQRNYSNALSGGTLIYSNAFNGGAVDINGTTPDYINPNAATYGGSLSAAFLVVTDNVAANCYGYQDGTLGSHDNSVLLPFTPTNGFVYNLAATLTFTVTPPAGGWGALGFATTFPSNHTASDPRIGSIGGNPWSLLNMFANGGGALLYANGAVQDKVPSLMNALDTPYPINLVLDTTTTNWTAAEYVSNTLIGTFTYTGHPNLVSFGYSQTTTTAGAYKWGPITISASQLIVAGQPASANVDAGSSYTNTVVAAGTPPFFYQWYTNGVAIDGATNANLILNPVLPSDAGSNYTVVVTNVYGAVTSSPAILGVYTAPQFSSATPITYTNPMTLFAGFSTNLGSSPSFSVSAVGALPLSYSWQTNGVTVGGATNMTFTFTNCQSGSPTNFSCIISNGDGTATNTWTAQYIVTPTAPYPQAVLADNPVAYWRMDEPPYDLANQLNDGEICNDFLSGNNGIYTNTALGEPGYYVLVNGVPFTNDPTETAAVFGTPAAYPSEVFGAGTNIDFSASNNAEFTVSVWANGGIVDGSLGVNDSGPEPANGGIVAKGGYGTEEFALDDGSSGGAVRFMVRNAAGTLSSANSAVQLGGNNSWHHLVGVCDESNGVVNLYVDGLLTAQGTIVKGSGLLPSVSAPVTIGADAAAQFNGALDDAAIFPYAMNASQVDALFQKSGGVNPLTFTAPVPPTNVVWRQDTTLTIPATALGTPPLGYYWTNLTTGAIVAGTGVKGATGTSIVSTITCTLTITNAAPSWSGDQLELVLTNATGSTNLFVTLFSYPPPITIGYTNSILYSNVFNGGTWSIAGTAPTVVNSLVGGTNSTWTDVLGTNDIFAQNGALPAGLLGNGLDNCANQDSWVFPFTPEPGFIYTETAVVTFSAAPQSWIGAGFAQNYVKNAATNAAAFNGALSGMDWFLLQPGNGNVEFVDGVDNTFVTNANNLYTSGAGVNTMVVVLDTTQPHWAQYAWINGVPLGTNVWTTSNPTIGSVGITQYSPETIPNNLTWNSWSLTAVSPNGFPPFLLTPLPTNSIALTNGTITLPATGYGTGPWGYYWMNNSTVLASGSTNDTAPDTASLSIASSSLSVGNLELVLTNALGTNITTIPLVSAFPTVGTNITWSVTNGTLYLSWPAGYTGVQLQAQTNSASVGLSTNWVNYNPPGGLSTATNMVAVPMNVTNGTVFFRFIH